MNTPDKFWPKVQRGAPDECWPWTGGRSDNGYGTWQWRGRAHKAHRVAFELSTGTAPGELAVCHKCDNPPCCNPAHLFAGTHTDNMRDMHNKGRNKQPSGDANGMRVHPESRPRGEAHGQAKLTFLQVREIKARRAAGERGRRLAREFGVSEATVSEIFHGRTWQWADFEDSAVARARR